MAITNDPTRYAAIRQSQLRETGAQQSAIFGLDFGDAVDEVFDDLSFASDDVAGIASLDVGDVASDFGSDLFSGDGLGDLGDLGDLGGLTSDLFQDINVDDVLGNAGFGETFMDGLKDVLGGAAGSITDTLKGLLGGGGSGSLGGLQLPGGMSTGQVLQGLLNQLGGSSGANIRNQLGDAKFQQLQSLLSSMMAGQTSNSLQSSALLNRLGGSGAIDAQTQASLSQVPPDRLAKITQRLRKMGFSDEMIAKSLSDPDQVQKLLMEVYSEEQKEMDLMWSQLNMMMAAHFQVLQQMAQNLK